MTKECGHLRRTDGEAHRPRTYRWTSACNGDAPYTLGGPRLAIRDSVLKEVVACGWEEARTKISPDALQLTSALMHSFVHELRHRATAEAAASDAAEVTPEHLERILPQLLLDFGP